MNLKNCAWECAWDCAWECAWELNRTCLIDVICPKFCKIFIFILLMQYLVGAGISAQNIVCYFYYY